MHTSLSISVIYTKCFSLPELRILVTLTPESEYVPSVAPYNTYRFTCRADVPDSVILSHEFEWIRETGPGSELTVTPGGSISIDTSESEAISVLSSTESNPGQYVYYCNVRLYYGSETVVFNSSYFSQAVTVTGKHHNFSITQIQIVLFFTRSK